VKRRGAKRDFKSLTRWVRRESNGSNSPIQREHLDFAFLSKRKEGIQKRTTLKRGKRVAWFCFSFKKSLFTSEIGTIRI